MPFNLFKVLHSFIFNFIYLLLFFGVLSSAILGINHLFYLKIFLYGMCRRRWLRNLVYPSSFSDIGCGQSVRTTPTGPTDHWHLWRKHNPYVSISHLVKVEIHLFWRQGQSLNLKFAFQTYFGIFKGANTFFSETGTARNFLEGVKLCFQTREIIVLMSSEIFWTSTFL